MRLLRHAFVQAQKTLPALTGDCSVSMRVVESAVWVTKSTLTADTPLLWVPRADGMRPPRGSKSTPPTGHRSDGWPNSVTLTVQRKPPPYVPVCSNTRNPLPISHTPCGTFTSFCGVTTSSFGPAYP